MDGASTLNARQLYRWLRLFFVSERLLISGKACSLVRCIFVSERRLNLGRLFTACKSGIDVPVPAGRLNFFALHFISPKHNVRHNQFRALATARDILPDNCCADDVRVDFECRQLSFPDSIC